MVFKIGTDLAFRERVADASDVACLLFASRLSVAQVASRSMNALFV